MDKILIEKRTLLVTQMRQLHELATKEERSFTTDEDAKWAALDADLAKVDAEIKRSAKLASAGVIVPSELRAAGRETPEQAEETGELNEKRVFDRFVRQGMSELSPEERAFMQSRRDTSNEARALSAGTGNTGGYTVPQDFYNRLEIALKAFGGMMDAAEIIRTDTGALLPMPSFNYTNVLATIVGENTAGGLDASSPFGVANLNAYTYRTPILPVSYEFLQDSSFGEGFIVNALSDSISRALNAHGTNGTGTGQPRGIALDAVLGKTGTTGQTATVVYDDLWDLIHSVDPAYRQGSKFMLHDQSLKVLRKMKDQSGRPIFLPGYDGMGGAGPDTIDGFAYVINQDMPTMAANAKSILFGRLDKYKLRIVKNITMMRLVERYADSLQVAFLLFMRADGRLLDAGTQPVKYYANSAT